MFFVRAVDETYREVVKVVKEDTPILLTNGAADSPCWLSANERVLDLL